MKQNNRPSVWTLHFAALIFLTIIINMGVSIIIPAMPLILRSEFDDSFLTVAFLSLLIARFITANVAGGLLNLFSAPALLAISFGLQTVIMLLFIFATTKMHFFFLRALEGVFEGIVTVVLQYVVAGFATPETRGRMMGIFSASFGLGFILGPIIGSILVKVSELQGVFLGTAVLMGFGLLATLVVYRTINLALERHSPVIPKMKQQFTAEIFRYLPFYSGAIIQRGLFVAFGIFLPLYLVDRFDFEAYQVSYYFTLSAVMTSLLMPWTGRFGDTKNKEFIAAISLMFMALSITAFVHANDYYVFTVFFIIETLAFSFMVPTTMSIFFGRLVQSERQKQIIGTASSSRDIMAIIIVTFVVPLYSTNPNYPWYVLSFLTGVAALPYLFSYIKLYNKTVTEKQTS